MKLALLPAQQIINNCKIKDFERKKIHFCPSSREFVEEWHRQHRIITTLATYDTMRMHGIQWCFYGFVLVTKTGDENVNVAAGRPSRQSSVFEKDTADRANDGNINGVFDVGLSCTQTSEPGAYPWWAVDLEAELLVRTVIIFNRVDGNYVHFINETLKSP